MCLCHGGMSCLHLDKQVCQAIFPPLALPYFCTPTTSHFIFIFTTLQILLYSYYFLLSFIWYLFFPTHLCSFLLHFLFSSHLPCLLQLFVRAAISCCFTHHNRPIPPFPISKSPLSMLNLCCYPKDPLTPKFRSFDKAAFDCKLSGKCLVFLFQHPN
jgi:hypothetical protein